MRAARRAGLADSALAKPVSPIGIPGVGGKQAAVIAAGVAAQLPLAVEPRMAENR